VEGISSSLSVKASKLLEKLSKFYFNFIMIIFRD